MALTVLCDHPCPPGWFRAKVCRRHARRVGLEGVNETSSWLCTALLVSPVLGRSRDVEAMQSGASERAAGGLLGGREEFFAQFARR